MSRPARLRARIAYPTGARSPRFALVDQHGKRVSSATLAGKPYVLAFLSTHCDASCQTSLAQIATATRDHSIRVVLISTTPETDTAISIRALLRKTRLDSHAVTYATRPATNIARILRATRYAAAPVRIVRAHLVDKDGRLRAEYTGGFNPADLAHDAATLASE